MTRDMDLVRSILIEVEAAPPNARIQRIDIDGFEKLIVAAHVEIMIDAGLLKGTSTRTHDGNIGFVVLGLSWSGHEFLEHARNEKNWKRAKAAVQKAGAALTIEIVRIALTALSKQQLGAHLGISVV